MNKKLCLIFILAVAACMPFKTPLHAENKTKAGSFSVLTYNVAGLPDLISQSHPAKFNALISPLLNDFDLVLVQEDFYYHDDLASSASHPHVSPPGTGGILGDGLARFSTFPFTNVVHVPWEQCHGRLGYANDCLTPKGFSFATHQPAPGVYIDVYNLHMDAGGNINDQTTRAAQMRQLINTIKTTSRGKAVIAAGDWNLSGKRKNDLDTLEMLLTELDMTDSCRALKCGRERIDRIIFRSSDEIRLKPLEYKVEAQRFTSTKGRQLSDHQAVSVLFSWEYTGE